MAAMVQQALAALRQELDDTKAQLQVSLQQNQQLRAMHQGLEAQHQQLEANTAAAFNAQLNRSAAAEAKMAELERKSAGGNRDSKMDLLNLKNAKPEAFGKEGDLWKPWAKKTKLFLNGKVTGFRAALKLAEREEAEIQPGLLFTSWALKAEADEQLHEFLLHQVSGRALQIAEELKLEGRGFETWRQLKAEFEPRGGPFELKVMTSLMHPPQCKDIASMHEAIVQWEIRMQKWEQRTGKLYPEDFRLPGLDGMVPEAFREEFDW